MDANIASCLSLVHADGGEGNLFVADLARLLQLFVHRLEQIKIKLFSVY